jgi:ABC-type multidrug transport system fused ATPase/permease subunit
MRLLCCCICSVLQYLKLCDQVYMMKDGHTYCRGTHDELMDREQDYVMLVNTHSSETGDETQ